MKPSADQLFCALDEAILRSAAWLIPADQRIEWHREWHAELWHVRRSCCTTGLFSWPAQREITAFCLGSFPDAFCVLRQSWLAGSTLVRTTVIPRPRLDGSAAQVFFCLFAVLAVCIMFARLVPGVHAETDSSRYQVSPGLILIQSAQSVDNLAPSISTDLFRNWKGTHQRYFDQFAFYRTAVENASVSSTPVARWRVTHASLNLFSLLGLQIRFASADTEDDRNAPSVILSYETWTQDFGANPHIAGSLIRFGHRTAKIAGVLPYGSWRLPGRPDAWILEPDAQLANDATGTSRLGYLLAHLTPQGESEMLGDRVPIAAHDDDADDLELCGVSFANRLQGPWGIYQFALVLALLALPAVTSVTLGESNYSAHRPSRKITLIRWAFLGSKFALIASIAYFASLDLSYWHASTYSPLAEFSQLVWCFSICLFGFRWALYDQRQRCPVCLRRVTHPAQVGLASRTFLGWNGTEMMCMGGHTLLHVPSLPTSWFSSQRWLYLDTSWDFLFVDSGLL
jgi:hypothetical protein